MELRELRVREHIGRRECLNLTAFVGPMPLNCIVSLSRSLNLNIRPVLFNGVCKWEQKILLCNTVAKYPTS